jgi:hypothetical protein
MREFEKTIRTLYVPGDRIEVRAWNKWGTKSVGRYPFGKNLVQTLEDFDADESGYDLYLMLNPTALDLRPLCGTCNGSLKHDVPFRRWFLLDGDPIRSDPIATDEQHEVTIDVMRRAKDYLLSRGFDQVVLASSGNGCHALVRIDAPNDQDTERLVRATQLLVSRRFSTPNVKIETFCDADRIVRCYGSLNRKGPPTSGHRYRRSCILE